MCAAHSSAPLAWPLGPSQMMRKLLRPVQVSAQRVFPVMDFSQNSPRVPSVSVRVAGRSCVAALHPVRLRRRLDGSPLARAHPVHGCHLHLVVLAVREVVDLLCSGAVVVGAGYVLPG